MHAFVDPTALESLAADVGRAQLAPLLRAFSDELARRIPELEAAINAGDAAAIGRVTHSIKGSALTFGAGPLGAAARSANDASRTGDSARVLQLAGEVLGLLGSTDAAVRRLDSYPREGQSR